jgi:hypothetical protein
MFAFLNAAMGDAGTLVWAAKYVNFFNRPVTGIRNTNGGGPSIYPEWIPRGGQTSNQISSYQNWSPNFPAYPSGHSGFGSSVFQIIRRFYGVSFFFSLLFLRLRRKEKQISIDDKLDDDWYKDGNVFQYVY